MKDEETVRVSRAREERLGEIIKPSVDVAVSERLDREKSNTKAGLAEWLMGIARETGPLMDDGRSSKELMDALYDDETGLPK